jgi:hypothetical protein
MGDGRHREPCMRVMGALGVMGPMEPDGGQREWGFRKSTSATIGLPISRRAPNAPRTPRLFCPMVADDNYSLALPRSNDRLPSD